MSDEKDQFPRFKKDDFGDGTGWLFAGGLVACATTLISEIRKFSSAYVTSDPELQGAITKMEDMINATMEAAYAPTEKK